MRKAFTLIELMISIVILTIIMLFLYKSYAELNIQNKTYKEATDRIKKIEQVKQLIFLDFAMSLQETVTILPQDKKIDIVLFQSKYSIHDRIYPYVGYIVKDDKLYRIESLQQLKTYPFDANVEFDVDYLGEVKNFRIYQGREDKRSYLADVSIKGMERILIKIKSFS